MSKEYKKKAKLHDSYKIGKETPTAESSTVFCEASFQLGPIGDVHGRLIPILQVEDS